MKNIVYTFLIFIQIISFYNWRNCKLFEDKFHLSIFDLGLRLNESINNDQGIPIIVVRMFHNKAVGTVLDTLFHYFHFIDISFLVNVFSFTGIFGIAIGIWYLSSLPVRKKTVIYVILFLIPLIEIVFKPEAHMILKLILLAFPYILLIIFGYRQYLRDLSKSKILLMFALSILSVWWLYAMSLDVLRFCIKY